MTPLGAVEINASTMVQSANVATAHLAKMRADGAAPMRRGDARGKKDGGASIISTGWVE